MCLIWKKKIVKLTWFCTLYLNNVVIWRFFNVKLHFENNSLNWRGYCFFHILVAECYNLTNFVFVFRGTYLFVTWTILLSITLLIFNVQLYQKLKDLKLLALSQKTSASLKKSIFRAKISFCVTVLFIICSFVSFAPMFYLVSTLICTSEARLIFD